MAYARGSKAYGFCDRCGFRYPLHELKSETEHGIRRNNRVCPKCFDPDHPQNFIHRVRTDDPQTLRDPRPDPGLDASRRIDVTVSVTGMLVKPCVGDQEVHTS